MKTVFKFVVVLLCFVSSLTYVNAISNKGFRADMSFLDFEEIAEFGKKTHSKELTRIINLADSPVQIIEASVNDEGTVFFDGLAGAENTYKVKVKNNTNRTILAYEVTWILKHPFEDYVFHKIHVNSIDVLNGNADQKLKFRKAKHYRDDAIYYVMITKVEFDGDMELWEAPELENYKQYTQLEEVKKEIDAMENDVDLSNPESIDIEALKKEAEADVNAAIEEETTEEIIEETIEEEIIEETTTTRTTTTEVGTYEDPQALEELESMEDTQEELIKQAPVQEQIIEKVIQETQSSSVETKAVDLTEEFDYDDDEYEEDFDEEFEDEDLELDFEDFEDDWDDEDF